MAYTKYSLTPANNNAAPPDGAPEGMLPSAVNDTMRDMMAQIRDVGDGIRDGTYPFTSGTVISANTSTNALRITQEGTGNALLVEDAANPDSSPFVIDASGAVINGYTSSVNLPDIQGTQRLVRNQQLGASFLTSSFGIASYINAVNSGASITLAQSRNTSVGSHTVVNSGDTVGALQFAGSDGTDFIRAARISGEIDGTPGTGDMPGRLVFFTTADGASTPTERLRIDSAGTVSMRNDMSATFVGTGSISGNTLTITAVSSGTLAVGDRVIPGTLDEINIIITALGTGTGGNGTYTINNSLTVASTNVRGIGSGLNVFRFTDTDTAVASGQPIGIIEWYGSDASTPGAGVKAYIGVFSDSPTPDTSLVFGTSDNIASTQALERWRIDSTGLLTAKTGSGLSISATAVTSPAATDGNVFSGTYTPTITNGTNVTASTANISQYMRVGNVVTVSGAVTGITTTASGASDFTITLPIASNFSSTVQCGGSAIFTSATLRGTGVALNANTASDVVNFVFNAPSASTSQTLPYSFTYRII